MKVFLLSLVAVIASAGPLFAQATLQLDKSTYAPGETITASWTGSTSTTDWVGIYPRGIIPDGNPASTDWEYVNEAGSVSFTTPSPIGIGEWTAWFLANDGYTVMPGSTPVDFAVVNPNPEIETFTASSNFAGNGPVTLSWTIRLPDQVTSLTLDDGVNAPVDVLGQTSYAVNPAANTTYTLDMNAGTDTASRLIMVATGNSAAFSMNRSLYEQGEPITATWAGVTGNPDSWVGIYKIGNTPQAEYSDAWNYLNGSRTEGGNVTDGSMQFNLPEGEYYAALFVDGGYVIEEGPILFSVIKEKLVKVNSVVKTGNTVTIEWQSAAGHEYDIYASDTMEGDPLQAWELLRFALPAEGDGATSFEEVLAEPVPAKRFYKVYQYEVIPD